MSANTPSRPLVRACRPSNTSGTPPSASSTSTGSAPSRAAPVSVPAGGAPELEAAPPPAATPAAAGSESEEEHSSLLEGRATDGSAGSSSRRRRRSLGGAGAAPPLAPSTQPAASDPLAPGPPAGGAVREAAEPFLPRRRRERRRGDDGTAPPAVSLPAPLLSLVAPDTVAPGASVLPGTCEAEGEAANGAACFATRTFHASAESERTVRTSVETSEGSRAIRHAHHARFHLSMPGPVRAFRRVARVAPTVVQPCVASNISAASESGESSDVHATAEAAATRATVTASLTRMCSRRRAEREGGLRPWGRTPELADLEAAAAEAVAGADAAAVVAASAASAAVIAASAACCAVTSAKSVRPSPKSRSLCCPFSKDVWL